MACGVPANVMGDVRRVMMNPLNYIHLEGEGEALAQMILFRNGRWSSNRGQEEIFELMLESGMIDDWGPLFEAEREAKQSLNSSDEGCITDPTHIDAYDQWVSAQEMDIHQPSYSQIMLAILNQCSGVLKQDCPIKVMMIQTAKCYLLF